MDILVLVVHSATELLIYEVFILTVLVFVTVVIVIVVGLILITVIVVLGDVLLARCLVILINDSDMRPVLTVIRVERVLPCRWTVIVFLSSDVDVLVLMMVVSSLPSPAVVGLGDVCLPYQKVLLAEHVAQVLRLLPHRRRLADGGGVGRMTTAVNLARSRPLLVLPLSVVAVVSSVAAVAATSHCLA